MQPSFLRLGLAAALLAVPAVAVAAVALSPIMQSWNRTTHHIDDMLSGSAAYDQVALRQSVQVYITDGTMVASRISGNSAEARDFAGRFHAIAADSQAALHAVGDPALFRSRFTRITDDCRSCHAIYNN